MKSGLELHDSRVDEVELSGSNATVHFSHACVHKSRGTPGRDPGTGWSQEALLVLSDGGCVEIVGKRPAVELLGRPVFVEDFK